MDLFRRLIQNRKQLSVPIQGDLWAKELMSD
jgi:hypothetical protein